MRTRRHIIAITSFIAFITLAFTSIAYIKHRQAMIQLHVAELSTAIEAQNYAAIKSHQSELVALGYLQQKSFIVPKQVGFLDALLDRASCLPMVSWKPKSERHWSVTIIASSQQMPDWQNFIEKWNSHSVTSQSARTARRG